jgi:Porin subfamily
MTLIKSILLGSAAGIVAVASAQAADLPTKKAAPVEYVKVCNVGGITGWTLPGSDTCAKLSGYMTAQFEGGNLNTQYNWGSLADLTGVSGVPNYPAGTLYPLGSTVAPAGSAVPAGTPITTNLFTGVPYSDAQLTPRVLIAASPAQQNTTRFRNGFGWTTRANFGFDLASNTAYGPLIAHFDLNSENGNGFDNTGNSTYLNTGYVTWAGITAGKAASFFSFTGGGDNWANFASPDQKGFNEPDLIAYTASFGGGFSATLAAQSPGTNGGSGAGTDMGAPNFANIGVSSLSPSSITYGGQKWPDFVGALHVKQGWGEAQVSGVIHNVNVTATGYNSDSVAIGDICGLSETDYCNYTHNQVGWGVDAGVKINVPQFGAGDNFLVTGAYTQSAVWYSGLPDMMWGENGQVNGNGQPMYMQDAYFNPLTNSWSKPNAWSLSFLGEHHFTPAFYIDLEASVGQLRWGNQTGCYLATIGCTIANYSAGPLSPTATTWLIGADIGWMPVTNLNFDLELMYQSTNQSTPTGFLGTIYNSGQANEFFVPGAFEGNSSGFAGRFRVTRYF